VSSLSMTVNLKNQESFVERILGFLGSGSFNLLIETFELGAKEPRRFKYCHRVWNDRYTLNQNQLSIPLSPGKSIDWDLKVERVVVCFESDGDILISRIFEKQKRRLILKLTRSPI